MYSWARAFVYPSPLTMAGRYDVTLPSVRFMHA